MTADVKHPACIQGCKPPKRPSSNTPKHKWRRQSRVTESGEMARITKDYRAGVIAALKATMAQMLGLVSAPKPIRRRAQ